MSIGRLDVAHFPADLTRTLGSDCIVAIDVLRSTTVIAHALANGAREVVPVSSPEEALARAAAFERSGVVLGGERGNARIDGFDAGNSPAEYTPGLVRGKTVIACTTNGTRALRALNDAPVTALVLCASFANLTAVTDALKALPQASTATLLCSGQDGQFSLEDFLCAGAIASRLGANAERMSDSALAALASYESCERDLASFIARGEHAQHLIAMGFANDVATCADIDVCPVAPCYRAGRIQTC